MPPKMVTLKIDEQTVSVPAGTLVVDAAKKIGKDIPVFCYHPKMEPVGMCRMCLVDIGRPMVDRATGLPVLEADGSPKLQFGPKLETACTTPVSDGMVVLTETDKVKKAHKEVVEMLLTSHPLDCPICDKGGECPLQNLTLAFGPGESRFALEDKKHLAKHVPLGELIWLDRERCIQCGRCVRFQHELADDPVINFYHRGRSLEIATFSEPGFDSVFSGNTTDICPVGALTTADFRFGARPWELKTGASICTHCPVGCNLTYNVRREANSGGKTVIKRAMPRQNEQVNEIWICDKGRLGYHYMESPERISMPLVRRAGKLEPVSWDEAIDLTLAKLKEAGANLTALAGGRLANEDLFTLHRLTQHQKGKTILDTDMGGGEIVAQMGLPEGSNLGALGAGSAILVVSSDLHQEAPIWWLRIRQAVKRGAALIVLNARPTRLDAMARFVVRSEYGKETDALRAFIPGAKTAVETLSEAARVFASAENAVIFYGSDGLGTAGSCALAKTAADLLTATHHTGRINNGLIPVWQRANDQGAWEIGYRPDPNLTETLAQSALVYIAGADPAGDDPAKAEALERAKFVVVQDLFLTATAQMADVVFPVLAAVEREGTFTSAERRVQRFYPVLPVPADLKADYELPALFYQKLGGKLDLRFPAQIFLRMGEQIPAFRGITYQRLADSPHQQPEIGRGSLYYGGTVYGNQQGVGVHLSGIASTRLPETAVPVLPMKEAGQIWLVPVTKLYDRGQTILPSRLLDQRRAGVEARLHPQTAADLGLAAGEDAQLNLKGRKYTVRVVLDDTLPAGVAFIPRSAGLPVFALTAAALRRAIPETE